MENWQVVAVAEIANLQRPRKKVTVEYLAWFMENILGSQLRDITLFGKHVPTREVKYSMWTLDRHLHEHNVISLR